MAGLPCSNGGQRVTETQAGGRPPADPRHFRWATWSLGWKIVALIPRELRYFRFACEEYALSASTRLGRRVASVSVVYL